MSLTDLLEGMSKGGLNPAIFVIHNTEQECVGRYLAEPGPERQARSN